MNDNETMWTPAALEPTPEESVNLTPPSEYSSVAETKAEETVLRSAMPADTANQDGSSVPISGDAAAESGIPAVSVSAEPIGTQTAPFAGNNNYVPAVHGITPINPEIAVRKSGKGLKVFALILAFVLVLTLGAGVGFIFGKEYTDAGLAVPDIGLAAKPADQDEYTTQSIYEMVKKSVVRIVIYSEESESYSNASGVIYSEDGYIVTNDHIYSDYVSPGFLVQTYDGKEYEAKFIAGDTRSDLAVLKIDANDLTPAVFGNSDELVVGETAVAVGNPDGAQASVATKGVISAVDVWVTGTTNYSTRLIQTDAALNPGSSGGALANAYGQVIGITSSKKIVDNYDLVNYAIPTTVMKRVVESLISDGYVTGRSKLGITYNEIGDVESVLTGLPTGLYLQDVSENDDLTSAGITTGDIITHVDGVEITDATVVLTVLENTPAGSVITLTVYRSSTGISTDVDVELVEYKGNSSYTTKAANDSSSNTEGGGKSFDFPFGD